MIARRGVALIIAISVLAALLFLALPFLFSQSASVAGARASSWDGASRRGSDLSAGVATAMSVYATGLHRSPALVSQLGVAQQTYVQLPLQINDSGGAIGYPSYIDTSWRLVLDSGASWVSPAAAPITASLDNRNVVHGAVIEDESRRIDPNILGERAWAIVLARAGIVDPFTVEWTWVPGPGGASLASVGSWKQADYGRLARALSHWRPATNGRFNRLEDLLGADPNAPESPSPRTLGCIPFGPFGYNRSTGAQIWPAPASSEAIVESTRNAAESDSTNVKSSIGDTLFAPVNGTNAGYRVAPLTQAELDRLRPFLSFLVPGQGRSGLIDLGTIVATAPAVGGLTGVTTDELSPKLMNVGDSLRPHNSSRVRSQANSGRRDITNGWASVNDALAMDAPPALNINTVPGSSGMVRLYSDVAPSGSPATIPGWPADPTTSPITSIAGIGRLRWLDPHTGDGTTLFARPPLGILGFGIVAIEGAATARDPQGNAVAQRRRRTVVQAVPQERPIEAAWRTQGEMEALILARHGSWIQSGPHPTRRIANWGDTAGDMAALDCAGWIEPAPVCSFARSAAVTFDWRVPFGLTKSQAWGNVLKEVDADGTPGSGPSVLPAQVGPSGLKVGALSAQGLRLRSGSGDKLAYTTSDTAGPLRFTASNLDELNARQVSFRFMLPQVPGGTVILAEVRNQVDLATAPLPSDAENSSLWRIEYRPRGDTPGGPPSLALVLANAALPWTPANRNALLGGQDWKTGTDSPGADEDQRCLTGTLPFAPPDPATRVEYRYLVVGGLKPGQWYHLQAFCASDRPGLHGLVLDGVVGRDATRALSGAATTGDHYTWPSLRINRDIAQVTPLTAGGDVLIEADLPVTFPAALRLADILPSRGVLRVDDEYFSYTGATDVSAGTGILTGVQRARRINTNQAAKSQVLQVPQPVPAPTPPAMVDVIDPYSRWPVTQAHVSGALATPGWSQVSGIVGRWRRGFGVTRDDFEPQVVRGSMTLGPASLPGVLTVPPAVGAWPPFGIVSLVCLRDVGAPVLARAAFSSSGSDLTLEWGGAGADATPPLANNIIEVRATLISLRLDGPVEDADVTGDGVNDPMWGSAAQLLDPATGRCEWIDITGHADRDAGGPGPGVMVTGKYLLQEDGWDFTGIPEPILRPRGSMRTVRNTNKWPIGTRVLPVQSDFDLDRLEAGDVITVVPDTVTFGINEPTRLLVRYAARDAFPTPASSSDLATGLLYDTINEWFALAHPVPNSLADPLIPGSPPVVVPQMAMIGRGWAGDDLSMVGNNRPRRGALPRRVLVAPAAGTAKVYIASADPRTTSSQEVVIDDLCAGALPGPIDANTWAGSEIVQIGNVSTGTIDIGPNALPAQVRSSVPVFQQINGQSYGLCMIDGEAFAYRYIDSTNALLIARALLGTVAARHSLAPVPAKVSMTPGQPPDREVWPTLSIVRLPLGPIGELASTIAPGDQGTDIDVIELPFSSYYRDPPAAGFTNAHQGTYWQTTPFKQHIRAAPCVVVNDPLAAKPPEVLRVLPYPTQANQVTVAPWLRGLYGTNEQTWTPGFPAPATRPTTWLDQDTTPFNPVVVDPQPQGTLNPIVIAWWPRFAPGLPQTLPANAAAVLRSRSFAWAGFPLRLNGARFDPNIQALRPMPAGAGLADVRIADMSDCDIEVRALAAGDGSAELFDWDASPVELLSVLGGNAITAEPFSGWASSRFVGREVDGAEMRVHWTPTPLAGASALIIAADAQGRAPRLGATDLEAEAAPAAGAGIRLRCVAPTRVLAVEEVR